LALDSTIKGVASSIVWKFDGVGWTKIDYALYGYGALKYLGKDYYIDGSSHEWGYVPALFFDAGDSSDITVTTDGATRTVALKVYYDLQDSYNSASAYFETMDYPLEKDSRVSEFWFQGICYEGTSGNVVITYSLNEGKTWKTGGTVEVMKKADFLWYSINVNETTESIRFKFTTTAPLGIGKFELRVAVRERGGMIGTA
jgi:hypothetical protein